MREWPVLRRRRVWNGVSVRRYRKGQEHVGLGLDFSPGSGMVAQGSRVRAPLWSESDGGRNYR
jgi:hypothetical protein